MKAGIKGIKIVLLGVITLLLFGCNLIWGSVDLSVGEVWGALTGDAADSSIRFIVLESRLPQGVCALLSGAALAASGLMLQTLFRNPLAGPSILGITSGASLGVALVMLLPGVGALGMLAAGAASTIGALAGSMAVMGVLIFLSARIRSNLTVLICGILTGYLASGIVSLLSSLSAAEGIRGYVMWGMGSFSGVSAPELGGWSVAVILGLVMAMGLAKPLDILLLGDRYAANLGVNVKRTRTLLLLCTGWLCAAVTAFCGPIGFLGLAMPHAARMLMRSDNHILLLPATMLCGAIPALACNIASTTLSSNVVPINALTPIVGVPIVIWVILRNTTNRGNEM